ncbi:hypothetical protein FA95DRAFT_1606843 [Auriscalpium vulgare]|uniref:Uncharacterized protein n=1 Tax=Auriscalpium vulgare TaxID=40419 RepID=A0ACB8RR33_9AGAM|nr:hypothetical protein FA95DRAFT_1606843 [Auriscalpium vulgare]
MSPPLTTSPLVSPSVSPAHSVASSPIQSRRVLNRRGSSSAADPWGAHLDVNMHPARTTSCKLTIVRVNEAPITLDEAPPSPQHRRHFGFGSHHNVHRRHSSHASATSSGKQENGRMSFASASFAGPGSSNSHPRSGSPTSHGHPRSSIPTKPRLTPDQLITLAQQSVHPRATPVPSPHSPSSGPDAGGSTAPASFTALGDDVYLPFVDRAAEVTSLFGPGQPSAKLLNLLAQTFPPRAPSVSPDNSTVLNTDPKNWSASQLEFWLKNVDRDVASDEDWVAATRRCILSHSELVWERIKGALGVPPELDSEDFDVDVFDLSGLAFDSALDESDGDEPQPAGGPVGLVSETLVGGLSPEPDSIQDPRTDAEAPASSSGTEEEVHPTTVSELSIEAVLAPTSPPSDHEHPPTRPSAHHMNGISEDVRGESDDSAGGVSSLNASGLLSPPREVVQGLRISTTATSPSLFASDTHPLAASLSSVTGRAQTPDGHLPASLSGMRRSGSSGSLPGMRRSGSVSSLPGHGSAGYAASTGSADVPYDVVGERGPGNPLFPTSFARLALGPTLSANNPSLRSPNPPPPPAFSNPHAIRAGVLRGRRGVPSWAEGWDPAKHEYAVTGSEGSVGGP